MNISSDNDYEPFYLTFEVKKIKKTLCKLWHLRKWGFNFFIHFLFNLVARKLWKRVSLSPQFNATHSITSQYSTHKSTQERAAGKFLFILIYYTLVLVNISPISYMIFFKNKCNEINQSWIPYIFTSFITILCVYKLLTFLS